MNIKLLFFFIFLLLQNFIFGQTNNDVESAQDSIPFEEKIFKVIEDMPRFPGCEDKGLAKDELKKCAEDEMLKFIYSNLKYPEQAKKNKREGKVIVEFIIERDGSMGKIELLKDIGDGCGEEAIRVMYLMKKRIKWLSGKSRGLPPRVAMEIPISFEL